MFLLQKSKYFLLLILISVMSVISIGYTTASADNLKPYPNQSIEWIVPFAPGSGADIFARSLAQIMEKNIGQNIVVSNKAGGSTSIGVNYVLGKSADGHTIFNNSSTLSFYLGKQMADGKSPFAVSDIKPIYRIDGLPIILVVSADSQFDNVKDFVTYAKKNPKKLKMGGVGKFSTQHFASLVFADTAKVQYGWVPFDGGAPSVVSLLGKNIDGIFSTYDNVKQHIQAGKLKTLAAASNERIISPDIPTFKESGYDIEILLWRGIFTKAGVPDGVVDKLENAIEKSLNDPKWSEFLKKFELQPFYAKSKEFSQFFKNEVTKATEYFKKEK